MAAQTARPQATEGDVFGGAPTPVTDTPEFKAAVTAAVREAMKGFAPQPSPMNEDARSLFQEMALAIADMAHQSNRTHKPVDPKILAARQDGQRQLDAKLTEIALERKRINDRTHESDEARDAALRAVTPKYRCITMVVLDDVMIMPFHRPDRTGKVVPVEFFWASEPNDAMIPLNDVAKEVHALFRKSRGARSEIERKSIKPLWMTDRGLVISGTSPQRREIDVKDRVLRDVDVLPAAGEGQELTPIPFVNNQTPQSRAL